MNRAEYMAQLARLLGDVPKAEREEALQYYNDYFDDAGVEEESGVIASLGSPEELARTIKAGLNDGGSAGEFTEAGFSGYGQTHKDEVMQVPPGAGYQNAFTGCQGAGTDYQNAFTGSQGAGYQNAYTGSQGTGTEYQSAYTGSQGTGAGYQNDNPGGQSAGAGSAAQEGSGRRGGKSAGTIILIAALLVVTSPVWIGLAGAALSILLAAVVSVLAVIFAFLAVGVAFVVAAVACFVTGVALAIKVPLAGISIIGASFLMAAAGILLIWLTVLATGWAVPLIGKGIAALCRRLFGRGGARA